MALSFPKPTLKAISQPATPQKSAEPSESEAMATLAFAWSCARVREPSCGWQYLLLKRSQYDKKTLACYKWSFRFKAAESDLYIYISFMSGPSQGSTWHVSGVSPAINPSSPAKETKGHLGFGLAGTVGFLAELVGLGWAPGGDKKSCSGIYLSQPLEMDMMWFYLVSSWNHVIWGKLYNQVGWGCLI